MHQALIALDPLFLNNVKLCIKDILELEPTPEVPIELYNLHDHIIKFVEICGIVVGVEQQANQIVYTVDDGTATINCNLWIQHMIFNEKLLQLGTCVRVLGKIETYVNDRNIIAYDIVKITDENLQLIEMLLTHKLQEEYKQPYQLPEHILMNQAAIIEQLENIPTSKAKETVSIDDLNDTLLETRLLESIQQHSNDEFPQPIFLDTVTDLIKTILITQQAIVGPNERQIKATYHNALEELEKKGYIKLDKASKICKRTGPLDIQCCILHVIWDLKKEVPFHRGGVRRDYIEFQVKKAYPGLEAKLFTKLIYEMVELGQLYISGDSEFNIM